MKVRYIGGDDQTSLVKGNIYECLGREYNMYRVIVDEYDEDIDGDEDDDLYPIELFEEIE